MRKADGTLATSAEENAQVVVDSFEKLYGRKPTVTSTFGLND